MSKLAFQATVTIDSATPEPNNQYRCGFKFSDAEGSFQGRDIQTGDVVFFDTTSVDPGTYTLYEVKTIHRVSWTGTVELNIQYMDVNDNNAGPPPLEFIIGATGVITRPTDEVGLMPVVSPSAQGISDTFSFYLINHNLVELLNNPPMPEVESTQLVTPGWLPINPMNGRVALPSKPIGDFVLGMGIVYLMDGSMAELTGITPVFEESENQWYAQIPPADLDELGGAAGALTVSYLTTKDTAT